MEKLNTDNPWSSYQFDSPMQNQTVVRGFGHHVKSSFAFSGMEKLERRRYTKRD